MPEARLVWLPLIVAGGLLYLVLALALVRRRTGPGSRTMGLTLCVIAVWLCSAAAEMLARGEDAYFTAVAVKYTAIAVTPPLVLLFICHYTERFTIRRGPLALLSSSRCARSRWSGPTRGTSGCGRIRRSGRTASA